MDSCIAQIPGMAVGNAITVFGTFCRLFGSALVETFRNSDEMNSLKTRPTLIRESIIKAVMAFFEHSPDASERCP
jgi:hypothetical protein